ncbi:MAG TPA: serine hydrolase domain-containing protein [Gemmataceae bacterium]|nr:serine hydrolase domain-containing protein [Gemmataceae bacterium]
MHGIPTAQPEEIGLLPDRLRRAYDLLAQWAREDRLPAAALCVGRKGRMVGPRFFGRHRPGGDAPLRQDALFLVASITKPVTVTAVMMLVERGLVALEDRVTAYLPKFGANGKGGVQVRHLMTHTSGLPDMLPNNDKLRAAHKPLSAFVEATCKLPLLFPPGTRVNYQSMGIAVLAEIVHQVSGLSISEFLRKEVFTPLGMNDTSLGWEPKKKDRIAVVRLPEGAEKTDWHWNTPYWLGFGAPWGGLITSPADFARFCQMMLNGGSLGDVRLLSRAAVRAMTTNQLAGMPQVPEEERRCRPWGLGWKLQWPAHSANFGDLLGPRAYGHWGATGTLCWIDPDADAFCILFTTQPQGDEGRFLARVSNAVAAALA